MRRPPLIPLAVLPLLALTACAPEPPTAPRTTATATSDPPSASPTATAAATPTATTSPTPAALPTTCAELYPPELAATLQADIPPLDDPALGGFLSTEDLAGLEVLGSGVPVLRCTWGAAGTPGLATTVSQVDVDAASRVRASLEASGSACDDLEGGVVCRLSQRTVDQTDTVRENGETHWFGSGVWIATHWVDYDPDDYTRALAARIAG